MAQMNIFACTTRNMTLCVLPSCPPEYRDQRTPWLATLVFLYIYAYVAETLRFSLYILQNSSIQDSVPGEKRGLGGGKKCWSNIRENLMYNRGAGFIRKPTTLGATPSIALLKSYLFYPSIFR
jgi:hypothetical protein